MNKSGQFYVMWIFRVFSIWFLVSLFQMWVPNISYRKTNSTNNSEHKHRQSSIIDNENTWFNHFWWIWIRLNKIRWRWWRDPLKKVGVIFFVFFVISLLFHNNFIVMHFNFQKNFFENFSKFKYDDPVDGFLSSVCLCVCVCVDA